MAESKIPYETRVHTHIADGLDVYRDGRVCDVFLNGAPDHATFPAELIPSQNITAIVRGTTSGSTRQVCVSTLQTTGAFSASYFIPNTTTANTFTGTLHGQFTYML